MSGAISMSYFAMLEERNRRLREHGFSGEPTDEELLDYALSLEDRLEAVCGALGIRLYQDVRGRWIAVELPKGGRRCAL